MDQVGIVKIVLGVRVAADGLEYAVMMGAKVSNNSYGGVGFDNAMYDAQMAAGVAGHTFVASAGNSAWDNDLLPETPGGNDLLNVISVAAVDSGHQLASFSEYGKTTVDLAAPGVGVLSTLPTYPTLDGGLNYGYFDGTSMAAPHVTGAIALMLAIDPTLTMDQIRAALFAGVQDNPALHGLTATGGELEIMGALNSLAMQSQTVTVAAGTNAVADFGATGAATTGGDVIQGYRVSETITGLAGDDVLQGNGGDDVLIGGLGRDKLTGGSGDDTFVFDATSGRDIITDAVWNAGDRIRIDANGVNSFADLTLLDKGPAGTVVSWAPGESVRLAHVAIGSVTADMFEFGGGPASTGVFASVAHLAPALPVDDMSWNFAHLVHLA